MVADGLSPQNGRVEIHGVAFANNLAGGEDVKSGAIPAPAFPADDTIARGCDQGARHGEHCIRRFNSFMKQRKRTKPRRNGIGPTILFQKGFAAGIAHATGPEATVVGTKRDDRAVLFCLNSAGRTPGLGNLVWSISSRASRWRECRRFDNVSRPAGRQDSMSMQDLARVGRSQGGSAAGLPLSEPR